MLPQSDFGLHDVEFLEGNSRCIPAYSSNRIADWQACVDDFSDLDLTVATDKLMAFSGIAKRYGALLQDEYVAGLWKHAMPQVLLWMVRDEWAASRPTTYRAPSWS